MFSKSALRESPTRASHKSLVQERPMITSSKSVILCLATLSRRGISQECLTKVSNQFICQKVSYNSAPPECPLTVTKSLAKIVREWQNFGILCCFLHDVCSQLVMFIELRVFYHVVIFSGHPSMNGAIRCYHVRSTTLSGCVWHSSLDRQLSRQNEPIPGVPSKVRGNVWTPSASQGEMQVMENNADLWVSDTKQLVSDLC